MSTHKNVDKICVVAIVLSMILAILFMNGASLGILSAERSMGYEDRLFSTEKVHTVDIIIDDWDSFISTAQTEQYSVCSVVIDGEAVKNVGIRGKGNTSLSNVSMMGSERYSFKIEFDQYDSTQNYHGLDKLSLNNLIQDNTYMKDYLVYQMMAEFGVDTPLCSYVYVTVNGEDWGLYLAVEGVEESFFQRNYGTDYGELYKPDSINMGGGIGNGMNFDMSEFMGSDGEDSGMSYEGMPSMEDMMGGMDFDSESMQEMMDAFANGEMEMPDMGDMTDMMGGMSSSDVKLQYIDDDPDSYPNIFDNAKTNANKADQSRLIASLKQLSAYENLDEVLNIDQVLRYFVVHNFVVNDDSYTGSMVHNYYLYEEDGQLSMIPWDYNLAFGTFMGGNASSVVNEAIDEVLEDRPMQAWIFSDETYTKQYYALYAEMLETVDIQGIIEQAYALIAPYVEKDPTAFCSYEEFESGVSALKQFCTLRTESVQLQLDGSEESVDTGELNLSDMGTMMSSMGNMMFPGSATDKNDKNDQEEGGSIMPEGMEGMPIPGGGEMPEGMEGMTFPEGMEIPEGMEMPEGMEGMTMPEGMEGMGMPSFGNGASGTGTDFGSVILLVASILVLAIGLVIAAKFKRRR